MAQQNDTGIITLTADGAIPKGARVKIASGKASLAGIGDEQNVGVAVEASFADGDPIAVALMTKPGTLKVLAAAAITAGALCYTAASGKVSVSASTAHIFGVAITGAGADGDLIEVMPQMQGVVVS